MLIMLKDLYAIFYKNLLVAAFVAIVFFLSLLLYLEDQLPDVNSLSDIKLQIPLKIYTSDKKLIAEYGEKRRSPVSLEQIPDNLINAVIATEDHRFYEHHGVDLKGILRAISVVVTSGRKEQGGSTITMQLARNSFLNKKKTISRKIKELLLSLKIENSFSKDKILELYLNQNFFGKRAYGVAAAAEVYFGAKLEELSLGQSALLAGLLQAPSAINPIHNPEGAFARRTHVLERMFAEGYITSSELKQANFEPINVKYHDKPIEVSAPYIAEQIRLDLFKEMGEEIYTSGLEVYTTLQSKHQNAANISVLQSVLAYDKRQGYKGPVSKATKLSEFYEGADKLFANEIMEPAIVISTANNKYKVFTRDQDVVSINVGNFKNASQINLSIGDIIYIERKGDRFSLSQLPDVEGAMLSMDPNTGATTSLVGGFSFEKSKFNRIMQAYRQPGSCFKPFIYSAALENGFTLASLVNDAPIVIRDPYTLEDWRPQNDNKQFNGPTRLRMGLTRSRNIVSINLLSKIGIKKAVKYLEKFGFDAGNMTHGLSLALGAAEITPMQLATGYSVFANGGFLVKPYLIEKIKDSNGNIILESNNTQACDNYPTNLEPLVFRKPCAEQKISDEVIYLIDSALKDTIKTGTARPANVLKRKDLAGKTGSTNDHKDAWFAGYNRDLVAVSWLGYDNNSSLNEYSVKASLPMWISFMKTVLPDISEKYYKRPKNIVSVKIDTDTGNIADHNTKKPIFEHFTKETVPSKKDLLSDPEQNQIENLF